MKFYFLTIIFFFISGTACLSQNSHRIILTQNADRGCLLSPGSAVKPGDTLVLSAKAGPWSYVYCGSLVGTASRPIIITCEGVVTLTSGFDIENCQYVKVSGVVPGEKFGFRITGSGGVAITVHGKSRQIEVDHFLAKDCNFGCWIKNEADCDTSINNWTLDNISIHDYELNNIKIEGFYLGSTDADNYSRPKDCNGTQQYYKPSQLSNISIYNGLINGTGRPAIMLSNARSGNNEIHHNTILNVGREYSDQQGTGISLGLYTRAYVHDNEIRNTFTWGIASLGGSGLIKIERNVIDNSGSLDGRVTKWAQNISIDTRKTVPADSTTFVIVNNIVGNPGASAKNIQIWITEPTYSSHNVICNNHEPGKADATVGVSEGIRWRDCKTDHISRAGFSVKWWMIAIVGLALAGLAVFIAFSYKKNPNLSVRAHYNKQASGDLKA